MADPSMTPRKMFFARAHPPFASPPPVRPWILRQRSSLPLPSSCGLNRRSRCSCCQGILAFRSSSQVLTHVAYPVDSPSAPAASRSSVLLGCSVCSNLHRTSDWYGRGSVSGRYPPAKFVIGASSRRGCKPSVPMPKRSVVTSR